MSTPYRIDALLNDPDVMEIMVNGHQHVYVEKRGKLIEVASPYESEAQLLEEMQAILLPMGQRLNESVPICDGRLWDGTRVHMVIPPIALDRPQMVLRKFPPRQLTAQDLIGYGAWNETIVAFLQACVKGRLNIVISGGTASGKTTVTNIVSGFIPDEERIITVEQVNELRFEKPHLVKLEGRPPNIDGKGEITMQQLVISATKMRPDRIITSELHASAVYDLLDAMNSGYDGTIVTLHATSPRDVLTRLEMMASSMNPSVPLLAIREKMASAIDVVAYQERLKDGGRRIMKVTEVIGMQGDMVEMQDIFEFRVTGSENGKITGTYSPTGAVPRFLGKLHNANISLPMGMFLAH